LTGIVVHSITNHRVWRGQLRSKKGGAALDLSKTALLIIDVQMAFVHRDDKNEPRSAPQAEENIARLLSFFARAT